MTIVAWIRKALGFALIDRVDALEKRKAHNERSIDGAIEAFKQFARDADR